MNPTHPRQFLLALGLAFAVGAQAQYTTPNTGQSYSLADLVDFSGGVLTSISDTLFVQNATLTIAGNDTLLIAEDGTWALHPDASIQIEGTFIAVPPDHLFITNSSLAGYHHAGLRFEQGAQVDLQRTHFIGGGSIKCLTEDLALSHCTVADQVATATTGAALELSRGKAIIDHVEFRNNQKAAISSAANIEAAPRITYCLFMENGWANENRPQINLGPSGADTTVIRGNTVIGDAANTMVGGIAFSSLVGVDGHVVIDSNSVVGNRYGIAVTGSNIHSLITNNVITDNNTQGNPMQGGSGINLNGTSTNVSMVSGNLISSNLWGVTLQNAVLANFGDTAVATFNPGNNSFANNGNGGVIYALYNNTPNDVPAMNNCWDYEDPMTAPDQIAEVIFDSADDPSLGTVTYVPFHSCDFTSGVKEASPSPALAIHPNPARSELFVRSTQPMERFALFDMHGRLVRSGSWPKDGRIALNGLPGGVYLIRATGPDMVLGQRVVVE